MDDIFDPAILSHSRSRAPGHRPVHKPAHQTAPSHQLAPGRVAPERVVPQGITPERTTRGLYSRRPEAPDARLRFYR